MRLVLLNVLLVGFSTFGNLDGHNHSENKLVVEDPVRKLASTKEERLWVHELARKSIYDEIDRHNPAHRRISDQVEPLIKTMMRSRNKNKNYKDVVRAAKAENAEKNVSQLPVQTFTSSPLTVVPKSHKKTSPKTKSILTSDDEDDASGSGDEIDSSGDRPTTPTETSVTTEIKIQITPHQQPHTTPTPYPYKVLVNHWYKRILQRTTSRPTTRLTTTTKTTSKGSYNEKRTHLHYYGRCMFCKPAHSHFERFQKEMRRKQFLSHLVDYDFVFLVQRFPSGLYANILSFTFGRTAFPAHFYVDIHAPLSCDCFTKADNTRYVLAGSSYGDKLVLNSLYPLYKIRTFQEVDDIRRVLTYGRHLISGKA